MSLETEYERLYQRNEPESLQNNFIKYVRYENKSIYPQKTIDSILDQHAKIFVPYTTEYEYQLDFRSKDKDKPLGVATIYHPTQVENLEKFKIMKRKDINCMKLIK